MTEPFKNIINKKLIKGMSGHFKTHYKNFDSKAFEKDAANNLDTLELKARSEQITQAMIKHLPDDYKMAGRIMLESLSPEIDGDIFGITVDKKGIAGWGIMPMTHYVGLRGHVDFNLSMTLFKEMTKRFSSEFGIRFFLLSSPKKTLTTLKKWTKDKNYHVRRLVSEGIRPRLPWAMQLPEFIQDPSPVVEILELLKDDKEEYVRRSVANNLNDIAKDHPALVTEIAARWMQDADDNRKKLIKHACRTLLKQGNKKALRIFGYTSPKIKNFKLNVLTPEVAFGNNLEFELEIISNSKKDQLLMIDYIIHHQKANGTTSPKVFKWRTIKLPSQEELLLTKKHAIKKITTRAYYPGIHTVEIVANGVSLVSKDFNLIIPDAAP